MKIIFDVDVKLKKGVLLNINAQMDVFLFNEEKPLTEQYYLREKIVQIIKNHLT